MSNIELTKEEFSKKIETYIITHNISYMDAIIAICDEVNFDYTIISKLLTKPIIEKIREEGRGLNLLPKILPKTKNKLPFA